MPLPDQPNSQWPPASWAPIAADIDEAAIWFAGDEQQLIDFYGRDRQTANRPSDVGRGFERLLNRVRFWSRRYDDQHTDRQRLHVPAAGDIAATSADILLGDELTLRVPEAHDDSADDTVAAGQAEERLNELADLDGWHSTLLEAAEVAAGLGGVYLVTSWDRDVADHPILRVVHADHAVPEFRLGRLMAVTFWRIVEHDGAGAVWRHLERHEAARTRDGVTAPATVEHGLYVGKPDRLGLQRPLETHPETAGLPEQVVMPDGIRLAAEWWPNVALNRKHRDRPVGRADCGAGGVVSLMDSLDMVWSAWMRDIRLAQGRIIVPSEFLDRRGRGGGASFDVDREVFTKLDIDPGNMEKAGITLSQFEIRHEAHSRTAAELYERIVTAAGYSPSTFGLIGDTAVVSTATEISARQDRTRHTRGRKERYADAPIGNTGWNMLIIDREIFGSQVEPARPRVEWPDPDQDQRRIAETVDLLHRAEAMSVEARVRMAQPDLEGEELAAEVERIRDERGLSVQSPTGLPPNLLNEPDDDEGNEEPGDDENED